MSMSRRQSLVLFGYGNAQRVHYGSRWRVQGLGEGHGGTSSATTRRSEGRRSMLDDKGVIGGSCWHKEGQGYKGVVVGACGDRRVVVGYNAGADIRTRSLLEGLDDARGCVSAREARG